MSSFAPPLMAAQGFQLPPWIYPPPTAEPYHNIAYVLLPAPATSSVVLSFTVPSNRNGVIWKVANNFVGGGWTEGSGTVTWQIFRDQARTKAIKGYNNIPASLGSPANPVQVPGIRIFENEIISLVVNNASVILAGQLSGGCLIGWFYPKKYEWPDVWV